MMLHRERDFLKVMKGFLNVMKGNEEELRVMKGQ